MQYEIRAKGHLPNAWQDWFPGLQLANQSDGTLLLSGILPDQAALLGVLYRLSSLNLALISFQAHPEAAETTNHSFA